MIEFEAVSRSYGSTEAVKQLDLIVQPGELFALLGHNGAGKTTTIKMLVGLLRPGRGSIAIDGFDVARTPREAAQRVGYVPDEPHLYDKLSGREFLSFVANMHGLRAGTADAALAAQIERFGLGSFVDQLTESYSHGMKQRTVFAAAMLHDPRVLVVDEPLVGLDPHSIRLVKDLLKAHSQRGATVFMSTHTLTAAEELADRIGVMHRGELIFLGTLEELREQRHVVGGSLESLYLSLVDERGKPTPESPSP
ncbi:ABC transporter ATP-binding protein [Botrimarina hoheduenensis]|uniref:ABC-type transporter ATP-binding protein EcsA n=1 Tax=Botrimarina hoheduenensis TaxID=2528000 RepID=A0A5C5VRR6_9BACT|nr:ABC transporter ATP-binding protein [Botrimarina hoheduenensis]TWT40262.1 ABC-type transporter ATP-binding protein EcsA [Botrimarina hoheduenensis]